MSQSSSHHAEPGMLARWARFAFRHKWQVIAAWVVMVALLGGVLSQYAGTLDPGFSIPNVESQHAVDLLAERFPEVSGDTATIVFRTDAGITSADTQATIDDLLAQVAQVPEVVAVTAPDAQPGAISEDGKTAYATVQFDKPAIGVEQSSVDSLLAIVDGASVNGLEVAAGGQVVQAHELAFESHTSEIVGILVAMAIMLVIFGSVVAMGLPIITAVIGLLLAVMVNYLFANWFTMSDAVTLAFVSMMGLGVGIDYALFIVNRYRDGLLHGKSAEDAAVRALDTSGRAVIFAGTTVAIALLGLTLIRIPFVTGMGLSGSITVVMSVLVSVFFMPALLGVVGPRVLSWRIPGLGREVEGSRSFFHRWGTAIQRRPGLISAIVVVVLLIAAIPVFSINLGLSDAGNGGEDLNSRRAYDLLSEGFGPGLNGPLLVVIDDADGLDQYELTALSKAIGGTTGVAAVTAPIPNQANNTAIMQVIPATSPQDPKTADLVDALRTGAIAQSTDGTSMHAYVGGSTAANVDLSQKIAERMPIFFIVVIGLSLVLLAAVFRSVVVPLKAALMNVLSIGVAFGAIVAVFQWGWLGSLIGVAKEGPVESFLPMILFGIVFGLSMDYEVFLLSRVHEEYSHTKDARRSMLAGVAGSGKVIAAAGGIMASVFFAFVLGVAVVVDAFIVRLILVPAVMTLLDRKAWYIPGWLDRVLPKLSVEGEPEPGSEPDSVTHHGTPDAVSTPGLTTA